ncbi:MAG: hypothetical protein KTR31_16170 [Myxococcales bacterium]|nr:hypothetical protein [Myxococcales bacterium]
MSVGLRVCTLCGVFAVSVAPVSADAGEVLVKRQAPFSVPSVEDPPEADVRCEPEIFVEKNGVPIEVRPDSACPEPYADIVRTVFLQWRFFSPRDDAGKRGRGQITIPVTFDAAAIRDQAWRRAEQPTAASSGSEETVTIPCPTKGDIVHYELYSEAVRENEAGATTHHIQFREILRLDVTSAGRRKAKLTYRSVDNELIGAPDTVVWNVLANRLRSDLGPLRTVAGYRTGFMLEDLGAFHGFSRQTRVELWDAFAAASATDEEHEQSEAPQPPGLGVRSGYAIAAALQNRMAHISLASCGTYAPHVAEDLFLLTVPGIVRVVYAPAVISTVVEEGGVTIGMRLTGNRKPKSTWRDLREVRTIRSTPTSPWPEWGIVTTFREGDSTVTHTTSMRVVPAP